MEKYKSFFNIIEYDDTKFPSISCVFKVLNEICISETMRELSEYGLLMREKERIDEKCPDISYEIPKNIIKCINHYQSSLIIIHFIFN